MVNKLNWLESRKLEMAILKRQEILDSITPDTNATLLQENIISSLEPVSEILGKRDIRVSDLNLALGDDPKDPLDEAITGTWLKCRQMLSEVGVVITDSGVEIPILSDNEQRSDELVKIFHSYRQNLTYTNTTDALDLVLEEFVVELATQRTDLVLLMEGTGIEPEALSSIETDAYSGHSDLWDVMVGKFEMLEVRKK